MKTTGFTGRSGRTIVELAVASTAMLVVLGVSVPALMRIAKAGDAGRTRTHVESDNSVTLTKIGRELQNTSLKLVNDVGQPVLAITPDFANAPQYLVAADGLPSADALGGPNGNGNGNGNANGHTKCVACKTHIATGHSCGAVDGTLVDLDTFGATPLNHADSGSGRRGRTRAAGRARSSAPASITLGDGTDRARNRALPGNSVLRFQKAVDFDVDAAGEVSITWSTPIEYRVAGRRLLRVQDGKAQVVTSNCSCFYVEQTDAGTVVISIVSERSAPAANEITTHSNQIEVRPKN